MAGAGRCGEVMAGAGRCSEVLKSVVCGEVMTGDGRCWEVRGASGRCSEVMGEVRSRHETVKYFVGTSLLKMFLKI